MRASAAWLTALAMGLAVTSSSSIAATAWVDALADRLSAPQAGQLDDQHIGSYFSGLVEISEVFANTCNPMLAIKPGQVPVQGAMGALGHVTACDQAKPLIFLRLQVASPTYDAMRRALAARLPQPCFARDGGAGSPAMIAWADPSRLLGVTSGESAKDGFTVYLERRNTGPSADAEGEASLRQDIEADVPAGCR